MENKSTEFSLAEHSSTVKELANHQSVFLFTIYNMDSDKPVPVLNLPPVIFIGGPDRSLSMVMDMGVSVDEALLEIGMNTRR